MAVPTPFAEALRRVVANTRAMESLSAGSILKSVSTARAALSGLEPLLQSQSQVASLAKLVSSNLSDSVRVPFVQSLAAVTSFESLRPTWNLRGLQMPNAYAAVSQMMRDLTMPSLKIIDFTKLSAVADQMREFAERGRDLDERTDAFLRTHGWPLPVSLPSSLYREVVGMADAPKQDVNRLMSELFVPGTSGYRFMTKNIVLSPLFFSRRPLLRQSFSAAGRGHWYVVINGLMPLVEGALYDAAYDAPATRPKHVRVGKAIEQIKSDEEQAWNTYIGFTRTMEALVVSGGAGVALFDDFDARQYGQAGEPRSLNRHAIAHGLARRYGSRRNALKLLLLLAVLADCLSPIYERRIAT
jgi:hypothetical protein